MPGQSLFINSQIGEQSLFAIIFHFVVGANGNMWIITCKLIRSANR
jgi:hypothetical protein